MSRAGTGCAPESPGNYSTHIVALLTVRGRDVLDHLRESGALTYAELLTRATGIRAGDREAASQYLASIAHSLETAELTTDERRRIYKLRKKWTTRADGTDPRWNAYGVRPGRPKALPKKYSNPEDEDPLLASIMRKYGTPIVEEP